jgi:hypothetical protein
MHSFASEQTFTDLYFSRPMAQKFNDRSAEFESDENEPAIVKYLRAINWHANER